MQLDTYAPIVLFVYSRLWHTRQTIEALQINELADKSELFIYSDAANSKNDQVAVQDVRGYIAQITGFKKIRIIEREKNWGLANSIIDGVTAIVNEYGKVIVLEDDLVTSPSFLKFMNDALDYYENNKKVWHISGWNYPIAMPGNPDVFLWRVMNCWGWATWADRWQYFEKDTCGIINKFDNEMIFDFDLDGVGGFWRQLLANKQGQLNTWAVFWYANIFLRRGLCLNPSFSFVRNIGHDGTGENCGVEIEDNVGLNSNLNCQFSVVTEESSLARERIIEYCKRKKNTFVARVRNLYQKIRKQHK